MTARHPLPQHEFTRRTVAHATPLTQSVPRLAPDVEEAKASGLTARETRAALDHLRGMQTVHAIDASAVVDATAVIWHYAVVLRGAVIGPNVSIGSHCEIGRNARIGRDSRIGSGTFIPPHAVIGERVFIGPHVMMCDDRHPRVHPPGHPPYFPEPPVIANDAVIGAGAVLLPGVRIGKMARVAAGALVTKDVPDHGCVKSEPARAYEMSATAAGRW